MIEIKHRLTGEVIYRYDGDSLRGADLRGAHLDRAMTDQRYITIGCIGREKRQTTYCFDTDTVWCGCFMGTLEEFAAQVEETHKDNPQHLAEYRGAIAYIKSLQNQKQV